MKFLQLRARRRRTKDSPQTRPMVQRSVSRQLRHHRRCRQTLFPRHDSISSLRQRLLPVSLGCRSEISSKIELHRQFLDSGECVLTVILAFTDSEPDSGATIVFEEGLKREWSQMSRELHSPIEQRCATHGINIPKVASLLSQLRATSIRHPMPVLKKTARSLSLIPRPATLSSLMTSCRIPPTSTGGLDL